ncbi:MAG: hypothetical protein VX331_02600 [Candidatus Thermoplasmatota archaeon]|nr:hypothetical protein [Candidatus Thermoplasmatota archaeon]MEC9173668.1 hypothetical protein [Candidatus Thermoplasmatota archaeon]MEE3030081.1 hypothetical protein [Candidatus Thermoplasmatota archaeon]|tara:strand:- start:843 stop:1283 length:441 start_codon:yes stop_codon:yes gene_type:complete
MTEDYEQLLKLTPEEMAIQILEKRRLLADQISFIIQGLEESVDQLQQKYDKIAPKYRRNLDEKKNDSKTVSQFEKIRKELKEEKTQLNASIRISKESDDAISYWTRRVEEGTGELDYDYPDLMRFSKAVSAGKMSRIGIKHQNKNN